MATKDLALVEVFEQMQERALAISSPHEDLQTRGPLLSLTPADRLAFYFGERPELVLFLQQQLFREDDPGALLQRTLHKLVNRELGDFSSSLELAQVGLRIVLVILTHARLDNPADVASLSLGANNVVTLHLTKVVEVVPPHHVPLLLTAVVNLLDDLHLGDSYQISEEEVNALLEECRTSGGSVGWWKNQGRVKAWLARLGVRLHSPPNTGSLSPVVYLLLAVGEHLDLLRASTKQFYLRRWNYIFDLPEENSEPSNGKIPSFLSRLELFRPILSMGEGRTGFRVQVGRARNTGYGTAGVNPCLFALLDFLKPGDLLVLEPPLSPITVQPVRCLEGPYLRLTDGSCVTVSTTDELAEVDGRVQSILGLGDLLVDRQDLPTNESIPHGSYNTTDTWTHAIVQRWVSLTEEGRNGLTQSLGFNPLKDDKDPLPTQLLHHLRGTPLHPLVMFELAVRFSLPLHPNHVPQWDSLSLKDWRVLRQWVKSSTFGEDQSEALSPTLRGKWDEDVAAVLEQGRFSFGRSSTHLTVVRWAEFLRFLFTSPLHTAGEVEPPSEPFNPLKLMCRVLKLPLFIDRFLYAGSYQGVRTVPHTATVRPHLHGLVRQPSTQAGWELLAAKYSDLGFTGSPETLQLMPPKAERGQDGREEELVEKVILRAKYGLQVFKDGLTHLKIPDAPLTTFSPREVGTSLAKLQELGYYYDVEGRLLTTDEQQVCLRSGDLILPQSIAPVLEKVAQFLNELATVVYKSDDLLDPTLPSMDQLVGQLVIGVSPLSFVGVLGRIIGFSPLPVCLATPLWHAMKGGRLGRGQEGTDSLVLAWDCLLNLRLPQMVRTAGVLREVPLFVTGTPNIHQLDQLFLNTLSQGSVPSWVLMTGKPMGGEGHYLTNRPLVEAGVYECMGDPSHMSPELGSGRSDQPPAPPRGAEERLKEIIRTSERLAGVDPNTILTLHIHNYLAEQILRKVDRWVEGEGHCPQCGAKDSWGGGLVCPNCGGTFTHALEVRQAFKDYEQVQQMVGELPTTAVIHPLVKDILSYVRQQLSWLRET